MRPRLSEVSGSTFNVAPTYWQFLWKFLDQERRSHSAPIARTLSTRVVIVSLESSRCGMRAPALIMDLSDFITRKRGGCKRFHLCSELSRLRRLGE